MQSACGAQWLWIWWLISSKLDGGFGRKLVPVGWGAWGKENSQIQVKVCHGSPSTEAPEHSQGHRAEDTWPRVKPWWGGALRPWHTPFVQGLSQCISLVSGCLSCWPWDLISVQARGLSVPMQNQAILSIPACMTGADSWKRVFRSNSNADFFPKSKSFALHCQFPQHPSPDEGNLFSL